jgi:hypothetical protein
MTYGMIALVVFLGAVGLLIALLLSKRARAPGEPRPLMHYVLLWPLLFDRERERDPARGDRLFTARELIGWSVVLALIVLGVVFFP